MLVQGLGKYQYLWAGQKKDGMSPAEGRIESEVLLSEIEAQFIYS